MSYLEFAVFWVILLGGIWLLSGAMDSRIPRLRRSQNSLQKNLSDDSWIFMPSWLSSTGFMFIPCLLITVGITWITVIAIEKSSDLAYFFGAYAGLMAVLVWLMGRQLWGMTPLLRFDPDGVNARALKGQTIAWNNIAEINLDWGGKGVCRLVIHLAPQSARQNKHSFLARRNSMQRVIPLGALRTSDVSQVLKAVQAVSARYANNAFQLNPAFERDNPKAGYP